MRYHWDSVKNEWLIRHRGISFEDVVWAIAHGNLLDVLISDRERYRGQKQFGETTILKTVIPGRKLTRHYLRKGGTGNGTIGS